MKINLFLIYFIKFLMVGSVAWAEPARNLSIDNIDLRAKLLLCQMSFCITSQVTVQVENYNNYIGYYHIKEKKISLNPDQAEFGMLLTLIHEYTHVYRSQFNKNEETWLSEGLAKLVEYKASTVWPESYQRKLKLKPLLIYENSERRYGVNGDGYSDSFWLVYYLYNHFGGDQFLIKVLQSKLSGWSNVLSAITELQESGVIAKNTNIINQDAILRHFALAMLLNDQFAAKYSLFYMGPDYTSLSSSDFSEVNWSNPKTTSGRQVVYSKKLTAASSAAREKYVVKSINPIIVEPVRDGSSTQGLYYILIY